MNVNSTLTLKGSDAVKIAGVATRLTQWGYEVKISELSDQTILATNALPRTLRKARDIVPAEVGLANLFASVGKSKNNIPPCALTK